MLGFARLLGADSVRDDLARLRASIRDRSAAHGESASR